MPALPRLTASGACASCGAYGGSQHRPTCDPERVQRTGERIRLGRSRRAARDRRTSAAVRARERVERDLLRGL
jgi:hypothetical protein